MDWMNSLGLVLWLVFLTMDVLASAHESPVIETKSGRVKGTVERFGSALVNTYYGIPFAKAPVGELRFRKTVPIGKWKGTLDATKRGPVCYQLHNRYESVSVDHASKESEDCLRLNIWSPTGKCGKQKDNMAVMVWINGGNFTYGSQNKQDGLVLSQTGDIIVVSVGYRRGMLGFLASGTEDAPGNAGMYDQVEALRWIKENIASFGGDSSRITLFGASGGSVSVSLLSLSPLSKDLFSRAIMQSASAAYLVAENKDQNLDISDKVSRLIGCASAVETIRTNPKKVVDCLRKSDSRQLTDLSVFYLFPGYGDEFLPTNPRESIINGEFKNCDLLIGNTPDEASIFFDDVFIDIFGINGKKDEHPRLTKAQGGSLLTLSLTGFGLDAVKTADAVLYYLNKVEGDFNEEVVRQVYTALGDYGLLCPPVYTAEKSAEQGNKVYYYLFDHRPSNTVKAEWMGVANFEDVAFVFGNPIRNPNEYSEEEVRLSKDIIRKWSNFAKTGNPDPEGNSWPLYSRESPAVLVLNTTAATGIEHGPHLESCNFWRKRFGF